MFLRKAPKVNEFAERQYSEDEKRRAEALARVAEFQKRYKAEHRRENIVLTVLAVCLVLLNVGLYLFGIYIVAINLNDIIAKGANFWNVAWILLTVYCMYRGTSITITYYGKRNV